MTSVFVALGAAKASGGVAASPSESRRSLGLRGLSFLLVRRFRLLVRHGCGTGPSTKRCAVTQPVSSPHWRSTHSLPCDRLSDLRYRLLSCPERAQQYLSDVACCVGVASAGPVDLSGVVYSSARVGGLASRLGGLAWRSVVVCGRYAVHAVDLVACWWPWGAVAVEAAGAGVQGVRDLAFVQDWLAAGVVGGVGFAGRVRLGVAA